MQPYSADDQASMRCVVVRSKRGTQNVAVGGVSQVEARRASSPKSMRGARPPHDGVAGVGIGAGSA